MSSGFFKDVDVSGGGGGGDVSKVGTPLNEQLAVWTGDGTLEGVNGLLFDGSLLTVTTDINCHILSATVLLTGPDFGQWLSSGIDLAQTSSYSIDNTVILAEIAGDIKLHNINVLDTVTQATILAISGIGNVTTSGTLVDNKIIMGTGSNEIESNMDLSHDGDMLMVSHQVVDGEIMLVPTTTGSAIKVSIPTGVAIMDFISMPLDGSSDSDYRFGNATGSTGMNRILLDTTLIFEEDAGNISLNNINFIDLGTGTTIENVIQTLANLGSVGSSSGEIFGPSGAWQSDGFNAGPGDMFSIDSVIFMDSDPILTLKNIAAFDSTTETTIEAVIFPEKELHVRSQADLEAEFGTNIIVPDGEIWTIVFDASFTLAKPIKIGLNTILEIKGSVVNTLITYTGTGAAVQNENPSNPINTLRVNDISFSSAGGQPLFDIVASILFRLVNVNIFSFASIGTVQAAFSVIQFVGAFDIIDGITLIEPQAVQTNNFSLSPAGTPTLTFITIISSGNPIINIDNTFVFDVNAQVLYLDPNMGTSADVIVQNTKGFFLNLFVSGLASTAVTNVIDFGGNARFAASGNDLVSNVGYIFHSGFPLVPAYRGTFKMSTKPTGAEYMAVGLMFAGADTGFVTKASLDQTDFRVVGLNNSNTTNSMFTGKSGLEIFGSEVTVTINTVGVPEVVTSASWAFNNLERFSIGVNNEGQLVLDDNITRRYKIDYSGTIEKFGGGSVDVGIVLLKNGSVISFNSPHTVNTGKIQIRGSDIVELAQTDTLQIGVINYADTSNIVVSQLSQVVNL